MASGLHTLIYINSFKKVGLVSLLQISRFTGFVCFLFTGATQVITGLVEMIETSASTRLIVVNFVVFVVINVVVL